MTKRILFYLLICFLLVLYSGTVALAEEQQSEDILTLNEAIFKALEHDVSIQNDKAEIEKAEAYKEHADDQLDLIPAGGSGYSPALEATWTSALKADLTWLMAKKSYDARIDGVTLDVCQQYWDVLIAEEKVRIKEASLEKARVELQNCRLKYQVGLVPELSVSAVGLEGLKKVEAELVKAEAELVSAQNDLEQAYLKLNKLIGVPAGRRPVLVDKITFHPLKVERLETEVNRALEGSPEVWLAEKGVELQKYTHDLMWATGQYRPYEAREAEKELAEYKALNARDATKLLVRNLYYNLMKMEENYKALQEALDVAEEGLRITQLMYDLGMATKTEVAEAELGVFDTKQRLTELAAQHSYYKLVFQKPWAPKYSTLPQL